MLNRKENEDISETDFSIAQLLIPIIGGIFLLGFAFFGGLHPVLGLAWTIAFLAVGVWVYRERNRLNS